MSMTGRVQFSLSLAEIAAAAVLGEYAKFNGQIGQAIDFAAGTGLAAFDLAYMAERSLADGATDSIDLRGALTSPLGVAMAAVELCAIAVINVQKDGTANTTALTLGGGSNKIVGLWDSLVLQPGSFALFGGPSATGLALTAGTADLLQVINAAGAINKYQIAAFGRSA